MLKVKLTVTEEKLKLSDKCLEYGRIVRSDIESLIPGGTSYKVSMEISNTYTSFVNVLRAYMLEGILIKSLDVERADIITDDKFILSDKLVKAIRAVPINQDAKYDTIKFSISVENKTPKITDIVSSDIVGGGKDKFAQSIHIEELRPHKFLKINNIKVVEGYGKDDANAFLPIGNIEYWPLDGGECSATSKYTKFALGYTTHRYSQKQPLNILTLTCNMLALKMQGYIDELKDLPDKPKYMSENIEATYETESVKIVFKNELKSFAQLVAQLCYRLDADTVLVKPNLIEVSVYITHTEPIKLLVNGMRQYLKEMDIFKRAVNVR